MAIRRAVLALVACGVLACSTTLRTVPGPPAAAVASVRGGNVRLITRHGDTLRLAQARVVGDSVLGTAALGARGSVSIPVADVESVAAVEPNVIRTVAGVSAAVVSALVIFYVTFVLTLDK